jgi:hypothetical protein
MELEEMFDSSVRSAGDFAGVFEYDGETGYFYLYDMSREESQRVLAAIRVVGTKPDFDQDSIEIKWDKAERRVGLFIRGALWAAFDTKTGAGFGGDYAAGAQPKISQEVAQVFAE